MADSLCSFVSKQKALYDKLSKEYRDAEFKDRHAEQLGIGDGRKTKDVGKIRQ